MLLSVPAMLERMWLAEVGAAALLALLVLFPRWKRFAAAGAVLLAAWIVWRALWA